MYLHLDHSDTSSCYLLTDEEGGGTEWDVGQTGFTMSQAAFASTVATSLCCLLVYHLMATLG